MPKYSLTYNTMYCIVQCVRRYIMDVQLKRGLLDVAVLAAIRYEASYGYRIVRDLQPYMDISESTLYPILRRLETGKCLTVRSEEHSGRLRKYYEITTKGLERIYEFQDEWKEIVSIYEFICRDKAADTTENEENESKEKAYIATVGKE